ncbi:ATP-binding protein [Ornithinicoccus hortensis]|uniref:ATPase family protein associated with various cellular activities (AAA) n=1 Tax=Ornithinicoccus hortensis TaxID=82346 RepID=A0A542YUU1_9MICO|nr:ATP-binding protein [Ornithinicoccus hortensis]TQL51858.1 ATPase family protein associated with various cellular activities (AAA) [Ornithinicoccus hortensis]
MTAAGPDLQYLRARLALLEDRVRTLVRHRQADDPEPDDPFRGLYVSDEAAARLLAPVPSGPDADDAGRRAVQALGDELEAGGHPLLLRRLAGTAGLDDLDLDLVLTTLLPDLDSRFERLYGYLNDDVSRRRATTGLALEVVGAAPEDAGARARLGPASPLVRLGLLRVEDEDRPFLTRALRVPDRVTAHLLGHPDPAPELVPYLLEAHPYPVPLATRLSRALGSGARLLHLREHAPGTGASVAAAGLAEAGLGTVAIDLTRVPEHPAPVELLRSARREALFGGAGLVAGPVEVLAAAAPEALRVLTTAEVPVLLTGHDSWDPRWAGGTPLSLTVTPLEPADRARVWARYLDSDIGALDGVAEHLALAPAQVARAVAAARTAAAADGTPLRPEHLRLGVQAQNAAGLERLARRIEPEVGWDDLVVTPAVATALRDVTARARHRHTVLTTWRMRRGGGRGVGITALFAGDSGTGKTMAAEVIAGDLGLDLYTVNLATVVDKYVGETEKNLERIFTEAAGVNAVLFFDEADAVFGKRSSVKDAHDRYANIESAYLLQRLESFDGLAVLATNLRANIDEAFTRRLDAIIDFPAPTEELRRELWARCLAAPLPVADDLDLGFCARSFELAGGDIRAASTTAAYLAAAAGRPVGMGELVAAVQQEYRKLGRLVLEREFGDYLTLLR